jgi:molybdate transport system substrate-binding protein
MRFVLMASPLKVLRLRGNGRLTSRRSLYYASVVNRVKTRGSVKLPMDRIKAAIAFGPLLLLLSGTPATTQAGRPERIADARPGDVRVLATAAIRLPLEAVREQASKAIGRPLVIEYGSARGNLKEAAMAGAGFEVALLLPDVDEQLLKAGRIRSRSAVIAKTEVAIGVRGDGPLDLGTPGKIRAAMLNAKSLRWSDTGAALRTVDKILDTLNIRDAVKARHNLAPAPVPLGSGEYEINIYPLSEILPNKNLRNAGPVIPELQVPVVVTATISATTPNAAAAAALVKFLQGPTIEPALRGNGFRR